MAVVARLLLMPGSGPDGLLRLLPAAPSPPPPLLPLLLLLLSWLLLGPRTKSTSLGRSLYASGPTTMSASLSLSRSFSFKRSAMQPSTPTTGGDLRSRVQQGTA